jgi:hypothetical protein
LKDEEATKKYEVAQNIYEEVKMLDGRFEADIMLNEGMDDVLKPMYANCKLSNLTTILQILNLQVMHIWKN